MGFWEDTLPYLNARSRGLKASEWEWAAEWNGTPGALHLPRLRSRSSGCRSIARKLRDEPAQMHDDLPISALRGANIGLHGIG
jgi:hypothetical protein